MGSRWEKGSRWEMGSRGRWGREYGEWEQVGDIERVVEEDGSTWEMERELGSVSKCMGWQRCLYKNGKNVRRKKRCYSQTVYG